MDLNTIFLGNTILQYAYFLVGLGLSFIIGKTISWVFSNTLTELSKKTTSKIDDFLVMALRRPITVLSLVIGSYLSFNVLTLSQEIIIFKDHAYTVTIIIFIAWLLTKFSDAFFEKIVRPMTKKTSSKLDDHILPIISKVIKTIVWTITIISILSNLGYDVTTIIAGLGIGGIAFAFAAQKTIADVFGGVSILFSKQFIIGDIIEIKSLGLTGTVTDMGLRNTRIKDFDGRINSIPNSDLSASVVKNITSEPSRKVMLDLGLTYNTTSKQINKAKEIITEIINKNQNCKDLTMAFNEFRESSINLKVIYYITDRLNLLQIQDQINTQIKEQFDKNKIEFAFPTQTIYLKK
ncbi:MAG: mechanosensitive ion channel family protein [Candidatus ainarchaeum sp.]|nr:mechanosensitive ion channel family protein [Candidatus ainarchaeum sp.]